MSTVWEFKLNPYLFVRFISLVKKKLVKMNGCLQMCVLYKRILAEHFFVGILLFIWTHNRRLNTNKFVAQLLSKHFIRLNQACLAKASIMKVS